MAEDRPSPQPAPPPSSPPSPSALPAPGQPYGSGQGAPPPASHPFGSPPGPPPESRPGQPPISPQGPGPYGPPPQPPDLWDPRPAPPPPASPEQLAIASRLSRLALLCAVTAPILALLRLPYTAVLGLGLGVLAIVLGVRARRAAVVARKSEAGGVVAVVLGSVSTAFITVVVACYLVFWGEITAYQDCMSGANTLQARTACSERLIEDARRRIGLD